MSTQGGSKYAGSVSSTGVWIILTAELGQSRVMRSRCLLGPSLAPATQTRGHGWHGLWRCEPRVNIELQKMKHHLARQQNQEMHCALV